MMGMLPTPGGIMLSGPMGGEAGDKIGVERSRLAAINFLFRHQWETVWPLFPAVPLIQSIFRISALTLISHNIAITLCGTIGGIIFLLLFGIPPRSKEKPSHNPLAHNLQNFAHAFWPILVVAALYARAKTRP